VVAGCRVRVRDANIYYVGWMGLRGLIHVSKLGKAEMHTRESIGDTGSGMGNTQPSPPPSAPTGINLLPFKSPWG
jgi:hypothetical protein